MASAAVLLEKLRAGYEPYAGRLARDLLDGLPRGEARKDWRTVSGRAGDQVLALMQL